MNDESKIDVLTRREIEARIIGPMIDAFSVKYGVAQVLAEVRLVIEKLAEVTGTELAAEFGGNTLKHLASALDRFSQSGECTLDVIKLNETEYSFNMTQCKYADMYKTLGKPELGVLLSCDRDFAFCRGFNPSIRLNRSQTIMEGAEYCDFRFELQEQE